MFHDVEGYSPLTAAAPPKSKDYLIGITVAVALIILVLVHTGALGPLSHMTLLSAFSFTNPLSYLLIVLLLAVVAFKIVVFLKVKRRLHNKPGKLSVKDILEAHKVGKGK